MTLKPNELMIGDILNLSEADGEIIPCKVVELHTEELYVIRPNEKACDVVGYDMVYPISITPEILEKNGFIYEKDYGSYYRSRYGDIAGAKYVTISWSYGKMCGYDIQNADNTGILSQKRVSFGRCAIFVHELQHLLRDAHLYELAENFTLPEKIENNECIEKYN